MLKNVEEEGCHVFLCSNDKGNKMISNGLLSLAVEDVIAVVMVAVLGYLEVCHVVVVRLEVVLFGVIFASNVVVVHHVLKFWFSLKLLVVVILFFI